MLLLYIFVMDISSCMEIYATAINYLPNNTLCSFGLHIAADNDEVKMEIKSLTLNK